MRTGELNERIVIQSKSVARNSVGEEIPTWSTLTTVWAKVRMASATERFQPDSDQVQATGFWDVTLRYRSDITPLMRLQWRGKTLNIAQVDPQRAIGRTVLRCEAVTDG
ncbi:MAG TPA: phage head closure protein [Caldilineaceae bacterium]|nr:phage head closure protein [Caldilineaceae bacterium]